MTLVELILVNLETGVENQVKRKFNRRGRDYPRRFVWLKPNIFSVAMGDMQGTFIFIGLKEDEKK